jgi:lipopolysaccharide export system protein LptC
MVAFFKVILPLLALAILATLFLVQQEVDLDSAIPFADVELEKRLRDQQITNPSFSAQTKLGHIITVTAATAHPDPEEPSRTVANELDANILMTNGQNISIVALNGEMDSTFQEVVLTDGVHITTSNGLQLDTDTLTVSVDQVRAESGGAVTASMETSTLEAGRMAVRPADSGDDIYLFFTKGVRLVYTLKPTMKDP